MNRRPCYTIERLEISLFKQRFMLFNFMIRNSCKHFFLTEIIETVNLFFAITNKYTYSIEDFDMKNSLFICLFVWLVV